MDYVQSHTPKEIAEIIKPQFKDADMKTLTRIQKDIPNKTRGKKT